MYLPATNKVDDATEIDAFLARFPFATLVSTRGEAGPELVASHVPLVARRSAAGLVLVGHVARANKQWRRMDGTAEALAIFLGPHGYVSPTWYAAAPAVPTWNYATVHAYGRPRAIDDAAFTREALRELVARHEVGPGAWTPDALPRELDESLVAAIVAFELPVTRLEAKFKLGQNRSAADRTGTIAGLERDGGPEALALAAFMRAHAGV